VETVREPLLILDGHLRVQRANHAFYKTFQVAKEQTEGRLIYDLGNRQWDILQLRQLLEEILPQKKFFQDYLVEYDFPSIGHRKMLLNARKIRNEREKSKMILLAMEDVTDRG
jgi:two-component system CheB/CheR fusion protein